MDVVNYFAKLFRKAFILDRGPGNSMAPQKLTLEKRHGVDLSYATTLATLACL